MMLVQVTPRAQSSQWYDLPDLNPILYSTLGERRGIILACYVYYEFVSACLTSACVASSALTTNFEHEATYTKV
jgi:hypothetical protein